MPLQVDPAAWAGAVGGVGRPGVTLPPMGAAKQQPTPTAQAAASISMFLASFCEEDKSEWALPSPTLGTAKPAVGHRLILLGPACLAYLIEAPEEGEEATEQGCTHAGDVDKGTLRGQQEIEDTALSLTPWPPAHPAPALSSPPCPGACRCPGHTSGRSPWPQRF